MSESTASVCGMGNCEAETDCDRRAQCRADGLPVCLMHYKRWVKSGRTRFEKIRHSAPARPARGTCTIDGCDRLDDGPLGLCKMHDTRRRRHGDALVVIAPEERRTLVGEQHPAWSGDAAAYDTVHRRIRRERGPATGYQCSCGARARHWSYDHTDPEERTSPEGHPYSTDTSRYTPRCVSCHKRFDLGVPA